MTTTRDPNNAPTPGPQRKPPHCPPFVPGSLTHELTVDSAIRWAIIATVVIGILSLAATSLPEGLKTTLYCLLVLIGWLGSTFVSAQVVQQLPRISAQLEHDLPEVDATLAWSIRRKPLARPLRLKLYEMLATLRHRQKRFAEAAALCQAVLMQIHPPWGPTPISARGGGPMTATITPPQLMRPGLLLMLANAQLRVHDEWGAYTSLLELHRCRLNLTDLLQRITLQTRYELQMGHTAAALRQLDHKLELAQIMSPQQCGQMHAMLAAAAQREGHTRLARWLQRRVHLISTSPKDDLRAFMT